MTKGIAIDRRDRLALLACLGAGFATLLDQGVIAYAVPGFTGTLGASSGAVQWFLAVYSLTFGLGLAPGGRLGDAFGRRGLFVAGLGLFFCGALVTLLAPSVAAAIAGRCIQGLGAGVISAQVLGIIQDLFVGRARLRALAAYTAAASASAIVGPLVAGLVLVVVPAPVAWRLILTVSLPFIAATALLTLRFVPRSTRRSDPVRIDVVGILLTAAFVLLATFPVVTPGVGPGKWSLVGAALVILLITLVLWERRLASRGGSPLFAAGLMRSAGFVSGNVVALLWFGSSVAQSAVLTIFLLQGFHLPGIVVALVLVPGLVARIAGSSVSTRIHARFTDATLPGALVVQLLALCVLITVIGGQTSTASLFEVVIVTEVGVGFASGVFEPPLRATTLAFAPASEHGLAASFLQLTQRLSATLCVALVTGVAFSAGVAGFGASELRSGLVVCAVLLAAAGAESTRMAWVRHRSAFPAAADGD